MKLPDQLRGIIPGVKPAAPRTTGPVSGRAPAILNDWSIPLGQRPPQQRGHLTPFPHLYPRAGSDAEG